MNVLLVEPDYYTKYPPLGLMKLASYYRSRGDKIKLIRGINNELNFNTDKILITSLFTYEDFEKLINRNVYILLILYYFVHEDSHRFCN